MLVGITGARGFIGENLIKRLDTESIQYKILVGDLLDADVVDRFVDGCDKVVHLAGIFSDDFHKLLDVNVLGTRNIVESCKKHGVEKIVFSSTGAVYGEPAHDGLSEEADALSPNTLYGLSKLYAEEYIRFSGISSVILRFPNVYGPGNEKGVIYSFLKSIYEKNEITIFGSGEQKRNFLFVSDAVESIFSAIEYSGNETVFNISDKAVYSLNDVADILKKNGLSFDVRYQAADESNVLQTLSEDISKGEKILGWKPKIDFEDGLRMMIDVMNTKNKGN